MLTATRNLYVQVLAFLNLKYPHNQSRIPAIRLTRKIIREMTKACVSISFQDPTVVSSQNKTQINHIALKTHMNQERFLIFNSMNVFRSVIVHLFP